MIRALLNIGAWDHKTAESLMNAIEPDNEVPHLEVTRLSVPDSLALKIKFDGGVETFISTLDDLLRCLQAAMETLNKLKTEDLE